MPTLDDILGTGIAPEVIIRYKQRRECPYCGSTNLDLSYEIELEDIQILRHLMWCNTCDKDWDEVYHLISLKKRR